MAGLAKVLTDIVGDSGLSQQNVELTRHTAGHGVDTKPHILPLLPATQDTL